MAEEKEEEKEYILHFDDGRVRRMFGKKSDFQKLPVEQIEEAPSSFIDELRPMSPNEGPPLPRVLKRLFPGR